MKFIPEMFNEMKSDAKKVGAFVREHQVPITVVTSTAAAVIVTRKLDTRIARNFAYEAGRENGVLGLQNFMLRDFIDSLGLRDQFFDHVKAMAGDTIDTAVDV